jgi:hypothetical protein
VGGAYKAGDEPGHQKVAAELMHDHSELSAFIAMGARLVQVTEDLCKLTGEDPQQVLDEFACDAIAVEAGGSITDQV